jgi:aryl-alcohol dehydrogenase-like predicted oxidoreductase
MHDLITQGKVLYCGTSEWSAQQITEAFSVAREYNLTPPTMEQPEYNMFHRERVEVEYEPLYKNCGLGLTIWSPLSSGLLTGKYNDGIPKDSRANAKAFSHFRDHLVGEEAQAQIRKVKELTKIAHEIDAPMACLALAWCLRNPNVSTVITGATKQTQVEENMHAIDILPRLTDDVMDSIEKILDNKPEEPPQY